ncbi:MAG: hypothetical protein AB7V32_04060, partial [Candidatus Berkiella sp.]
LLWNRVIQMNYINYSSWNLKPNERQIVKDLLALKKNNKDPEISAEIEKVITELSDKFYQQYTNRKNQNLSEAYFPLVQAASLGHSLAQLEIIKMLAKNDSFNSKDYYLTAFGIKTPETTTGTNFRKLFEQASKIMESIDSNSKSEAEQILKVIKERYVEQVRSEIINDLKELEDLRKRGDVENVTQIEQSIREKIAEVKKVGISLSFDLALAELPAFKESVGAMPVNPDWLTDIRANLEDDEQQIRLNAAIIQDGLQNQRDEKLTKATEAFLGKTGTLDSLKAAMHRHEQAENSYYELLKKEKVPENEIKEKLAQIQACKEEINKELGNLQSNFENEFQEFKLTAKDKEFIAKLYGDQDTLSTLKYKIEPKSPIRQLHDATERVHRSELIQSSNDQKSTVLDKTKEKLEKINQDYRLELKKAMNQVAESVEPGKNSKAKRQYDRLKKTEHELNELQKELQQKPDHGLASYQGLAQRMQDITDSLEKDLKDIGSLKRTSKAKNAIKAKINGLLKAAGIENQFRINTALTATQQIELSKTTANKSTAAKTYTLSTDKNDPQMIRRRDHVLFRAKAINESKLNYSDQDLDLAKEYINKNLNQVSSRLAFDNSDESMAFQALLRSGVYAQIKQSNKEPILLEFKSLDGAKSMTVGVTKYMFDEYIKNQRDTKEDKQKPHI